jgi:hypothetical protein
LTPLHPQIEREARYDVYVAVIGLLLFFGCMLALPRSWFWFYFVPMAAFWVRYLFVRDSRDEALLSTDLAASGGSGAAGCYRSEAGICISDGTHQVLIAREQPQALLQLPDVVRRE